MNVFTSLTDHVMLGRGILFFMMSIGSLPCILKSNRIGLQVKLGRGERERNEHFSTFHY